MSTVSVPSERLSDRLSSFRVLSLACCCVTFFYGLVTCPHSKVEESFQLQATHDLYFHGIKPAIYHFLHGDPTPYDHIQFPGVVPRTFVGPLVLSTMCQGVRLMLLPLFDINDDPLFVQFLARFILMMFSLHGLTRMARALDRRTKSETHGNYLLLITACQFHIPFYASRMLPNVFAMILCMHSYASWIDGDIIQSARLLVVSTAAFRCDILLLLFAVGISWLVRRELGFIKAIRIGIGSGILTLAVTVPLDSLLWQRLVWPEGQVFYFNTILNKSSEWGVSAWHWYLSSALPKALLFTVVLVPVAVLRIPEILSSWEHVVRRTPARKAEQGGLFDKTWLPFLLPAFGFVALYSCLGHKEVRFLFPVLPLLNVLASAGAIRVDKSRRPLKDKKGSTISNIFFIAVLLAILLSCFCSFMFVGVSKMNYPGGVALNALRDYVKLEGEQETVNVYIDNSAAMTGVSLFGQRAASLSNPAITWEFAKAGYEEDNLHADLSAFSYLIVDDIQNYSGEYDVVGSIQGNPSLDIRSLKVETSEALYVLKRKENTV